MEQTSPAGIAFGWAEPAEAALDARGPGQIMRTAIGSLQFTDADYICVAIGALG